ncbi:hypothetical protein E1676_26000 [Salmonella enterica subsp. enterica serovar Beaudesert]|nr:hypothetical protein [Salmonella enterica]EBK4144667.1 hypothetical protein [Salmonella enterica]ECF2431908.1 hypothetical protein [Salmonella enterica subsp. enterica serovar Beaudesert]EEE2138327.1 hypothetical protein [Salmonella enterica subsp. enterica serovar Beaudesert]
MKEVKIYTIVSDQLSPPITGESFCTDMVRHSDYAELEDKYAALAEDNDKAMESLKQADAVVKLAHEKFSALAAENAHARERHVFIRALAVSILEHSGGRMDWRGAMEDATELLQTVDSVYAKNPATDVFLAEVRASARNEGINYAASRLAAAFNHGFLDKPVSEVLDVTRMILSAKEDLANDPLPTDDGLSGEYAEKAIEEWADQLRKGAAL